MSLDHSITISEDDFARLHALGGHVQLAAELENATVVKPDCIAPNVVTMNAVLATVGMASLGVAVGHSFIWPFPDGTTRELLKLIYQAAPE